MRFSLSFVLVILLTGLAMLITLMSFWINQQDVRSQVVEQAKQQFYVDLNQLQNDFERFLIFGHTEGISQSISAKAAQIDTNYILVTNSEGIVSASITSADISQHWLNLNLKFDPQQYQQVVASQAPVVQVSNDFEWIDGMIPVCENNLSVGLIGKQCGIAIYRKHLQQRIDLAMNRLRQQSFYIAAGSILSALLILLICHFIITKRVVKIKQVLSKWIEGNREEEIGLSGNDELSDISKLIDTLVLRFKLEEKALQRSTQLNKAIIRDASYAIISTTPLGIIKSFNAAAENMLGYSANELINIHTPEIFHDFAQVTQRAKQLSIQLKEDIKPGFQVFTAVASQGKVYHNEWKFINKNGVCFPVSLSITALFDENRKIKGYLGVANDISAQKKSERELLLADKVFNNTSEAIIITDTHLRIVNINRAYTAITGYTQQDATDKRANLAASGRHDKKFYREMWQRLKATGSWSGEIWNMRKDGEVFPALLTINTIKNHSNEVSNYVGLFKDITNQKDAAKELEKLAYYDQLTQLPNRLLFTERLERAIVNAKRDGSRFALMYMDLNRFKFVNDTYGHEIGDELLIQVARRLNKSVREIDTVSRLGGDEFTIILNAQAANLNLNHVSKAAKKYAAAIDQPFKINGLILYIGTSIGIAIFPNDGLDCSSLWKNADTAMYKAKELNNCAYMFFAEHMNQENHARLILEAALRTAMKHKQLTLKYQPVINLQDQALVGFEALLRWNHPKLGSISPNHFISIAEDLGLIGELGEWVLKTAILQQSEWQQEFSATTFMAINVSAKQLQLKEFTSCIKNAVKRCEVHPGSIHIEITESSFIADHEDAIEKLTQLRSLGFKVSVDDFGTGYSSLSYLKSLPIDTIKIDQTFVKSAESDPVDLSIVKAVLSIAESMNIDVVAEGIETISQQHLLIKNRCKLGQGYLYSRPLSKVDASECLKHSLYLNLHSNHIKIFRRKS